MRRTLWIGLIAVGLTGLGLVSTPHHREAAAQKTRDESQWVYKVEIFSYNPGDRLSDEQRAASYERALNERLARGGSRWARS